MGKKKIAIIGGGIGGLTAGLYLAKAGFETSIFEKNEKLGGKAYELAIDNFRFDKGPSLLTMPFILEQVFSENNLLFSNFLRLKKLDVICKYFFEDGTEFYAYSDFEKLSEEIENKFGESKKTTQKYFEYCKTIYDLTADVFLFRPFEFSIKSINKKTVLAALNIFKIDPFRTMHQANRSFFRNFKAIQLFDRYATYNGSDPYKAPATLNIIQHVEYNLGAYIPENGIYDIVKAYKKALENYDVKIYANSEVNRILLKNNKATGIIVNEEKLEFDSILSNADVEYTYDILCDNIETPEAKRYRKFEKSSSALVFYIGVKGSFNNLETHNIFFSKDYKKEFYEIFNLKKIPEDPTIYLYVSKKINPNDAPTNWENWFVMINVPSSISINEEQAIRIKEKLLKKIFNFLNFSSYPEVIFFDLLTPELLEKHANSLGGAIYGISSNSKIAAFLRQKNKSRYISKLYFAGGSAHPGGGIPLVALSGKIASELIIKDFKI